ncbi:MAG: hypothetical protein CO113_14820 [Elusimicrobia bacterium CG_4_9_14_3_um_filter_62_55]|nr:MAG: hypothetical protein COR54_04735 [Elusimicrobia bacterium CG22_combo_CG10-13_8_21_14_all_63_91]PJA18411.1 MAG: hypothetical protein COX66_01290 [Elusimicrobia bacterium CG_4_10_14_0_2_um_filter_63_34]PJB24252.1 MAG: hypothetical protein CO113_14820 [Elusimicrobia bacterium CG_4_9_14_3_um_filter_62_55]
MRSLAGIKPQDILVLLKLTLLKEQNWRHKDLVDALGLSQAEISFSLQRCVNSGLLTPDKKRVIRAAFCGFLIHGLRYVMPARLGPVDRGIPTAHSASPLNRVIVANENDKYVWPHEFGTARGQTVLPIYPSAVKAAMNDPELHELLALIDALRVGRAREKKLAVEELERRLKHPVSSPPSAESLHPM